jgi:16S rRNA C967 or C1407 C5-methylase (RsmB/RsmF family)/NOL1/NOP2/fmu family ribosome biogenesis protein
MRLPEEFIGSLIGCRGFNTASFLSAHQESPAVSIRTNPLKVSDHTRLFEGLISGHVPWCTKGFYLNERPSFTLDPLLHAGAYYVQEASSMFLDHVVKSVLPGQKNLKALDLCASPGGKSTLLASMDQFDLVLSNEIISTRLPALNENIVKWGSAKSLISNNDPKDFKVLGELFDVVLVDAPCSGSGLFRKDPDAMGEWSTKHVDFCSVRQQRILHDAIAVLKPGGFLVYSTCSYSREENEYNVDFLLDSGMVESVAVQMPDDWGIVTTSSDKKGGIGYRFYPDHLQGEGFFCSVFQKTSSGLDYSFHSTIQQLHPLKNMTELQAWVKTNQLVVFEEDGMLFGMDESIAEKRNLFKQHLRLRKSGIRLGALMKKGFVPDHELALSELLASNLRSIDLSLADARKYLRKDDLEIPAMPDGTCLVTYQNIALGWSKIIRNRLKNNYPVSWRIFLKGD